ncbi:MAG: hypothetical protein AAFX78_15025 [Cyanobacteria bacterium J06638_20]
MPSRKVELSLPEAGFGAIAHHRLWILASLAVPLVYGGMMLVFALRPFIVQDDTRQHIVWMKRWADPELFPGDWIMDYFQSASPLGVRAIYRAMAAVGIEPLLAAKLLPIAIAFVASFSFYRLTLRLFPVQATAFLAVLLFNQQLWLNDDLSSASPRAFVYPCFMAFLDFWTAESLLPCLGAIALLGLFFPPLILLAVGALWLRLVRLRGFSLRFSKHPADYRFAIGGLIVAAIVLLPFILGGLSDYGPIISAEQMRAMPEYGPGGRNQYFVPPTWRTLFKGSAGLSLPYFPTVVLLGLAFPFLSARRFPWGDRLQPSQRLFMDLLVVSLGLFLLAHIALLRLHFPNRYTYHTWRIILPLATAIILTLLLERGWHWLSQRRQRGLLSLRDRGYVVGAIALLLTLVLVPVMPRIVWAFQNWVEGDAPEVYTYLAAQPKDTLVASLALDANNIPTFTERSLLVGREFALPHHRGYYAEISRRAEDLVRAQYTDDPTVLRQVIDRYGIDFWLLDVAAFEPDYLPQQDWLFHSSFQSTVQEAITEAGRPTAIQSASDACTVLDLPQYQLLDAQCLRKFGD